MEITENIRLKLSEIGENFDEIKPFLQKYLIKIEEIIEQKTNNQLKAVEVLKTNMFSVLSISKELDCSRTTLYNHNNLLKKYIEHSLSSFNENNPIFIQQKAKDNVVSLKNQLNLLINRDIQIEIIKMENIQLQDLIDDKTTEIERLRARIMELSSQLHKRI